MSRDQELMRVADLAPLLGVTSSRLYQLLAQGRLPYVRVGRSIRIPREAWNRWLEEQAQRALDSVRNSSGKR